MIIEAKSTTVTRTPNKMEPQESQDEFYVLTEKLYKIAMQLVKMEDSFAEGRVQKITITRDSLSVKYADKWDDEKAE